MAGPAVCARGRGGGDDGGGGGGGKVSLFDRTLHFNTHTSVGSLWLVWLRQGRLPLYEASEGDVAAGCWQIFCEFSTFEMQSDS